MRRLRCFVGSIVVLAVLGVIGGGIFIYAGVYDIGATEQHTPPVYWLIEGAMRRAVHARSGLEQPVPDVSSPEVLQHGLGLYHAHCERCHGGPGVAPEPFALGLTPAPANLTDTARRWKPEDIFWVIKYGIKMTAMPAWMYRLDEREMRDVSAFVSAQLRELTPADYRKRAKQSESVPELAVQPQRPRPVTADEGKRAIQQYACATCHEIPGITGAAKDIGPPLKGVSGRTFIAGTLANTRRNMIAWLMSPSAVKPQTAMPDLGVTEQDARAIAVYLDTLQ